MVVEIGSGCVILLPSNCFHLSDGDGGAVELAWQGSSPLCWEDLYG